MNQSIIHNNNDCGGGSGGGEISSQTLVEGRYSVLKGAINKCIWKARQYSGRVHPIEQLCINMELHSTFHRLFNVNIDRIGHVCFIFTRTPFRTSHAGIGMAPQHMHQLMLMPTNNDTNQQV